MKIELISMKKKPIWGGQDIVLTYNVLYRSNEYIIEGKIRGLDCGILQFNAETVIENCTWNEDTLTDEVILDLVNDNVR